MLDMPKTIMLPKETDTMSNRTPHFDIFCRDDSGVSVKHRNDSWSFDIAKAAKRYTFSGSFFIGFFSTFPAQTAEAWGTAPDDRRAYRKSARFYSAGAVHRSWLQDRPD